MRMLSLLIMLKLIWSSQSLGEYEKVNLASSVFMHLFNYWVVHPVSIHNNICNIHISEDIFFFSRFADTAWVKELKKHARWWWLVLVISFINRQNFARNRLWYIFGFLLFWQMSIEVICRRQAIYNNVATLSKMVC